MATDINVTPTAGMPPVQTTTTGTTSSSGTSGITPSAEAQQAAGLEQEALKAQAGATEQAGEQIPVVEEQKAAGADAQAAALEAQAAESQKVRENYLQRIEYAQTQAQRAQAAFSNYQFHSWWSKQDTGSHIQSVIAGALGGFAAGLLGTRNYALDNIRAAADRDFEMQRQQLSQKERSAEWATKGVTDLYGQMQHDLAALEIKHGLALKAIAEKAQAALVRAGIPAAQAANDATVQGLMAGAYAKDLAAKQRYEQHFDRQATQNNQSQLIEGKGGGTGVEADKNAANFAVLKNHGEWLAREMPKLSKDDIKAIRAVMDTEDFYQGDGTIRAAIAAGAAKLGLDPETGVSSKAKEYLDRVRRAAEGLGRVQSGAAIGTVENKRFVNSLMPKASDSPEDLQGRAERIIEDINSRGAYLSRPPRTGAGAGTGEGLTKEQIRDKIRRTNQYLHDHPGAKDAAEARASLNRLHAQLHTAPTQPPPLEASP
jgi:hypothetical protein